MNRNAYIVGMVIIVVLLSGSGTVLAQCGSICNAGDCGLPGDTRWINIYDKVVGTSSYPDGGRYCIGNSVAQDYKDYDVHEKKDQQQTCTGPFFEGFNELLIPICACYWQNTGDPQITYYEVFTGTSTTTLPCPADYPCCLGNDLADCTYSCVDGSCLLSKTATGTCPEGQHCEGGECKDDVPEFPAGVTAVFGATLFIFLMMRRKYIRK